MMYTCAPQATPALFDAVSAIALPSARLQCHMHDVTRRTDLLAFTLLYLLAFESRWLAGCMGFLWVNGFSFFHCARVASPFHSFVTISPSLARLGNL